MPSERHRHAVASVCLLAGCEPHETRFPPSKHELSIVVLRRTSKFNVSSTFKASSTKIFEQGVASRERVTPTERSSEQHRGVASSLRVGDILGAGRLARVRRTDD